MDHVHHLEQHLEQLNQTIITLSTQNQTAINQLIETQMSQKEAFTTMAEAAEERGYNLDFTSIPIFDGENKAQFHEWYRHTEYTRTYSKETLDNNYFTEVQEQ